MSCMPLCHIFDRVLTDRGLMLMKRQDQLSHRQAREAYCRGRPRNVVSALRLRSSRADVMACSLSEISGHAGCYLVAKSEDTLKLMYYDDVIDAGGNAQATFEEYKSTLNYAQRCYCVNIPAGACSCPDNKLLRMPCKHMFMIFKYTQYTFSDLPASLVSSPPMIIDADVVQVGRHFSSHYPLVVYVTNYVAMHHSAPTAGKLVMEWFCRVWIMSQQRMQRKTRMIAFQCQILMMLMIAMMTMLSLMQVQPKVQIPKPESSFATC